MNKFKILVSFIVTIALLLTTLSLFNVYAETVKTGDLSKNSSVDNVTWELDSEGILTISGKGIMKGFHNYYTFEGIYNKVNSVKIEEGVENIGSYIFSMCEELSSISIPVSITEIGEYAFADATSLKNVYFAGTEAQWSEISISNEGNNYLLDATIKYNEPEHICKYENWTVINEPTCTSTGSKIGKCNCNNEKIEIIPATGIHIFEWKISQDATCTKNGMQTQYCKSCGLVGESKNINQLGHQKGDWELEIEATCTNSGLNVKKCTTCGEILEKNTIALLEHNFGDWKIVVNSTEESEGIKTRTCNFCKLIETRKIDRLPSNDEEDSPKDNLIGDADGNGTVMASDARLVLQIVAGIKTKNDIKFDNADVSEDDKISAVDARLILQIVAGIK